MLKKTKAQFSVEFIVLFAFMFLIFLGFIYVITTKVLDAGEDERQKIAEDIAALVNSEIEIGKASSDGYVRLFTLPLAIKGIVYTISIIDDTELVVNYLDKEFVTFLPQDVQGDVKPGLNEISRVTGTLFLRHIAECTDGVDNDGDGFCDLSSSICTDGIIPGDVGCADSLDNDETDCGDNICEAFETCLSCTLDCGVCPSVSVFVLADGSTNVAVFDRVGNLILRGVLNQNRANINPSPGQDEFVVNDVTGDTVAMIRLKTGEMFIKGNLFDRQSTLSPGPDDFVVNDADGTVVSYIDSSGNVYLKSILQENEDP